MPPPPPHPARALALRAQRLPFSWLLLFSLTILVALRSGANSGDDADGASGGLQSYPWLECLAPLWAVDLLYAGVAGYVAANTMAGRFVMAPTQGLCFALLLAALAGSTVAEMLLTGDHRYGTVRYCNRHQCGFCGTGTAVPRIAWSRGKGTVYTQWQDMVCRRQCCCTAAER